ncbi:MAG: glycosyltransferase family 4 protein [Lachnospiraceae bacterium]|nr:glycosyltransferase family 4 protein [Lachnospiraceae bacterium]
MKIAIDLTSLSDNFSGLERCALEITRALVDETPDADFVFVIKNEIPPMLKSFRENGRVRFCRIRGKNKLVANQITLPLTMSRIGADAYVFPAFPVPLLFSQKNTYGMIADLGCYDCPETMKKKQVLFFREGAKHTAKVSRKVLTISEFSAGRICELLKQSRERILLLYMGTKKPEPEMISKRKVEEVRDRYKLPERYLLSLSTVEPRKNLKLLIDAYLTLVEKGCELPGLVLAGRQGWLMEEEVKRAVDSGRIVFTGFIDEEDLPAVYAGAETFVFPSLYEGFGMPPLEAQACGVKRVVASDAPALKEVLGETALFFRNNVRADLERALREALKWDGVDASSIADNLARFSWSASGRKLGKTIKKDLALSGDGRGAAE